MLIVERNGNGNGDLGGGRASRLTQAEPVVVLQFMLFINFSNWGVTIIYDFELDPLYSCAWVFLSA